VLSSPEFLRTDEPFALLALSCTSRLTHPQGSVAFLRREACAEENDHELASTSVPLHPADILRDPSTSQPARLFLETLETRLAPASVFVVPLSQPIDGAHFYDLGDALTAAGANGVVTIEPGANIGNEAISEPGLTLQGDPNVPASIFAPFALSVEANNVTVTNLHLSSLRFGAFFDTFTGTVVRKCVIHQLTESAPTSNNIISQNLIAGDGLIPIVAFFHGNPNGVTGDQITNNTFEAGQHQDTVRDGRQRPARSSSRPSSPRGPTGLPSDSAYVFWTAAAAPPPWSSPGTPSGPWASSAARRWRSINLAGPCPRSISGITRSTPPASVPAWA